MTVYHGCCLWLPMVAVRRPHNVTPKPHYLGHQGQIWQQHYCQPHGFVMLPDLTPTDGRALWMCLVSWDHGVDHVANCAGLGHSASDIGCLSDGRLKVVVTDLQSCVGHDPDNRRSGAVVGAMDPELIARVWDHSPPSKAICWSPRCGQCIDLTLTAVQHRQLSCG